MSNESQHDCRVMAAPNTFDHEKYMQWANYSYSCSRIRELAEGTGQIPVSQGPNWIDLNGIGSVRDFRMAVKRIPASNAINCMILYRDGTMWKNLAGGKFDNPLVSTMITTISKKVAEHIGVRFENLDLRHTANSGPYEVALLFPESVCGPVPPRAHHWSPFGHSGGGLGFSTYVPVEQDLSPCPSSRGKQPSDAVLGIGSSSYTPLEQGPSTEALSLPTSLQSALVRDRRVRGLTNPSGRHITLLLPGSEEMKSDISIWSPRGEDYDAMDCDYD